MIERALHHERWMTTGGLVLVAVLAWAYTLAGTGVAMIAMPTAGWSLSQAGAMLAMWWIMMMAMMLPSAAPTILLAAELNRRSGAERPPFGATGAFTAGYLLAWLCFSTAAVALQWSFQAGGLLSPMMQVSSSHLAGGVLVAAGLWQLTPVKRACLRHCRSPVEFLVRRRRPGNRGALLLGAAHGSYCVGCCWALMVLLFVGGVMNPYWIVALTLYVLAEKLYLRGEWIGKIAGAALIVSGIAVLAG